MNCYEDDYRYVFYNMSLEEFVFSLPLYFKVDANGGFDMLFEALSRKSTFSPIQIEGYNANKRKESTFSIVLSLCESIHYDSSFRYNRNGSYLIPKEDFVKSVVFRCQRYSDEITILVFVSPSQKVLMKVGQYPSVADIHIGQIKQYDKVLDKHLLKEFTKAIGLAANGVGVGSFVYLRRVFERLILDAFEEAKVSAQIDASLFHKSRMEEKIQMLRGLLPPFIVDNHGLYGILSKGIHELEESECLAYFDCMRTSIEMILDQRVEMREKKLKEEKLKKQISEIASRVS